MKEDPKGKENVFEGLKLIVVDSLPVIVKSGAL